MKGYMYILKCSDDSYYTGSTTDLELRLQQHQNGEGANHTKKRLPVKLVYYEEYPRIDEAFYREKQVQGWSRKKKEALINGNPELLPKLAIAYRDLRDIPVPEVLEGTGNGDFEGFENLTPRNHRSMPEAPPVSEALEDTNTETPLVPEALEGTDTNNEILKENPNKPKIEN